MSSTFAKDTDLSGKIALVTGGGTGIGLMIANGLAENGAKVYITGRRFEVLEKAAGSRRFDGPGSLIPLQMDVTDKASIRIVVDFVSKTDGKLDVLVNNAGAAGPFINFSHIPEAPELQSAEIYGKALFDSQSFEGWSKLEDINLASLFFVTTAFLGLLVASTKNVEGSSASVINITSATTHSYLHHGVFAYVSLKSGAARLSRTLAQDFALKGFPVRINTVAPGLFPSEINGSREKCDAQAKTRQAAIVTTPAQRSGRDNEMAAVVLYLASAASAYTNGQDIAVDGGFSLVNP